MTGRLISDTEEGAIIWWLAGRGHIWPDLWDMPEIAATLAVDGKDDAATVLNYLIRYQNADISAWHNLPDEERSRWRAHAAGQRVRCDRSPNMLCIGMPPRVGTPHPQWGAYAQRYQKRVWVTPKGKVPHWRQVWCKTPPRKSTNDQATGAESQVPG